MSAALMDRHEFWCRCGGCVEIWTVGSIVFPPSCSVCGGAMREVMMFQFEWRWNEKGRRSVRKVVCKTKPKQK